MYNLNPLGEELTIVVEAQLENSIFLAKTIAVTLIIIFFIIVDTVLK
jgi:hypothetical protein